MTDWSAIRNDYENGVSFRALAAKYDVSKTYIIEKRNKEEWNRPDRPTMTDRPFKKIVSIHSSSMPPDALAIAGSLLEDLAHLVQGEASRLDYSEHVKASRALSEYVKVLIVAPRETETQERLSIPLDTISPRTRLAIQRLLAEDEQEKVG
jgi:hypothetical protein